MGGGSSKKDEPYKAGPPKPAGGDLPETKVPQTKKAEGKAKLPNKTKTKQQAPAPVPATTLAKGPAAAAAAAVAAVASADAGKIEFGTTGGERGGSGGYSDSGKLAEDLLQHKNSSSAAGLARQASQKDARLAMAKKKKDVERARSENFDRKAAHLNDGTRLQSPSIKMLRQPKGAAKFKGAARAIMAANRLKAGGPGGFAAAVIAAANKAPGELSADPGKPGQQRIIKLVTQHFQCKIVELKQAKLEAYAKEHGLQAIPGAPTVKMGLVDAVGIHLHEENHRKQVGASSSSKNGVGAGAGGSGAASSSAIAAALKKNASTAKAATASTAGQTKPAKSENSETASKPPVAQRTGSSSGDPDGKATQKKNKKKKRPSGS